MNQNPQRRRAGKRLLVAAIGVASVSYVSTQSGCAPDADFDEPSGASSAAYDDEDTQTDPAVSHQALSNQALSNDISAIKDRFPPVGNLVPPPPVGNLVPPPVIKPIPIPFPPGNLMAPPPHEFEIRAVQPEALPAEIAVPTLPGKG